MEFRPVEFPFKCVLSLASLIAYWESVFAKGGPAKTNIAEAVRKELEKFPELTRPIEDPSILETHREVVELLMSIVFPPAFWETDCSAAFFPFHFRSIYATPAFKRLLIQDSYDVGFRPNLDRNRWEWGRFMKAYLLILKKFYDMTLEIDYPLVITTADPDTGLDRHLKITMDPKFLEIRQVGDLKPLSKEERERLLANISDPEVLLEIIPPQHFEFQGFGVFRAVDVTDQEVMSSLKRDLIEKESIFSRTGFEGLQEKLRTFLGKPELQLGLAAVTGDEVLVLSPKHKLEKGCIFEDSMHCRHTEFEGSIFAQAIERDEALVIEDLRIHPKLTWIEEHMLQAGIRSVFVTPLYYKERLLGTFDLKSPGVGDLNWLNTLKLWELLPLFSMALNRGMEDLDHRIQAIIKEKCTAIHPTVEWRFQRAAMNYIHSQEPVGDNAKPAELEPIVFRDVYPIYGSTDVRGSGSQRNAAIKADLIEQLEMAKQVIDIAAEHRSLPILDALGHRINKNISQIRDGITSGDEVAKLDFLRREIEPLFNHIGGFDPAVKKSISDYWGALDKNIGAVYRKRREFEESITKINDAVSSFLDKEEDAAQDYFPHYFEKMKTDGVDHTIYIGASMAEHGGFDVLYLRNLRLWQLIVLCGIARRVEAMKDSLKIPLDVTHLVLVQDTPLSIRFRQDERRFDVDGAYDIRHEIIKKRIDKAMVKGDPERLTQPGKIAIVYSSTREAREYRHYIDYLQATGYLEEGIENLDLQELQDVQGLKALRVTAKIRSESAEKHPESSAIQEAVDAVPKLIR